MNWKSLFLICAVVLFLISGCNDKIQSNESPIVESKYTTWYKEENKTSNFDHPYVKWVTDKKGNGTFLLILKIKFNTSDETVNEQLGEFGKVYISSCYQKECYTYLEINELEKVKNLFEVNFIEEFHISSIRSDYKLNDSFVEKIKDCVADEDCIRVRTGCCSCSWFGQVTAINKNFEKEWENQFYCVRAVCVAGCQASSDYYPAAKCINKRCDIIKEFYKK